MGKLKERFIKPDEDVKFRDMQQDMIELIRSYKLRVNTNRKDQVLIISKDSEDWRIYGGLEFSGLKYCLWMSFRLKGDCVLSSRYIGDSFEEFVEDLSDVVIFYNSTNYMKLRLDYEKLQDYIKDNYQYRGTPADKVYKRIIKLKQTHEDLADVSDIICKFYANRLVGQYSNYPLFDMHRTEERKLA